MSGTLPAHEPDCLEEESDSVELLLQSRPRDLGGFSVRRVLPAASRRLVGPFIFFDHFGPTQLPAGTGMDVRPHPHIGLCTVTYLYEGEIIHRDSLGNVQPIRPGDINWMVAGRGIVHSERSSDDERRRGPACMASRAGWRFRSPTRRQTLASSTIPRHHPEGRTTGSRTRHPGRNRLRRPLSCRRLSPTLYVHGRLEAGARLPIDDEHAERAIYVAEGSIRCDGRTFTDGTMVVLRPGRAGNHRDRQAHPADARRRRQARRRATRLVELRLELPRLASNARKRTGKTTTFPASRTTTRAHAPSRPLSRAHIPSNVPAPAG